MIVRIWKDQLLADCLRVIDAGGGRVEIVFSYRRPNKIVPIIHTFPDNQRVCQEIEVEEED